MVTFEQAYWYTNSCPLRQLKDPVFPEAEIGLQLKKYLHKSFIDIFNKEIEPQTILKDLNIKHLKRGIKVTSITKYIEQAFINYGIWKLKHENVNLIDKNITGVINNLSFSIDLVRFKAEETRIQLLWFRYDSIVPSINNFIKLVEQAQWNARGFELTTGNIPMQLTYFFPLLGNEYSVLYNTDNGYDTIANLITKKVFFTRPSTVCDFCDACPMTWAGYKGNLTNE